jgi:hypothetical protein
MKANDFTNRDQSERDRWRNNVETWDTMAPYIDRMLKHTESMGPGMMTLANGRAAAAPPAQETLE